MSGPLVVYVGKIQSEYSICFCLACEAEARHRYCFSGGVGGINFCRVFWFSSVSQEL